MKKAIVRIITRFLLIGVAIVVLIAVQPVDAQTLRADYRFQGTLNSSVPEARELVNLGGGFQTETVDGTSRTVFRFRPNDGLQLSPTTSILTDNGRYSIVLLFRFEWIHGLNRVIDFRSADPDNGAYIQDGHLDHGGGSIAENQYVQIVYTRNGTRESQRAYVDGVLAVDGSSASVNDLPVGPSNTLVFFVDDGYNASAGAIARLRIYDRALSASDVSALDRLPRLGCYSISPQSETFLGCGGDGVISVTGPAGCLWSAQSDSDQVIITSAGYGTGNGTVRYFVQPATAAVLRTYTITFKDANLPSGTQTFSISQSPVTPGNQLAPLSQSFPVTGGEGTVHVCVPALTAWTVEFVPDWITIKSISAARGPGVVKYSVSPGGGIRSANLLIAGKISVVSQDGISFVPPLMQFGVVCPLSKSPSIMGEPLTYDESIAYGFRDEVLKKTARGREYTHLYYQFGGEVMRILFFNPDLFFRTRETLQRYEPVIQAMVNRRNLASVQQNQAKTVVTEGDLQEIEDLIRSFAREASPDFKRVLKQLRRDLRDEQVQVEFGITVVAGAKRDLPPDRLVSSLRSVGPVTTMLGLCFAYFYRFARRSKRSLRIGTRRILAMVVAGAAITNFFALPCHSAPITRLHGSPQESATQNETVMSPAYAKVPLSFEANQGQVDPEIKFLSRGSGYNLFLTPTQTILSLRGEKEKGSKREANAAVDICTRKEAGEALLSAADQDSQIKEVIRVKLLNANSTPKTAGIDELPGKSNYFIGEDAGKWVTGVPRYARVRIEQVYEGVDLIYYGSQDRIEYDFTIAPGSKPDAITLGVEGADRIEVDGQGDLVLHTSSGEVRQRRPLAYQEVNGVKREVACEYRLTDTSRVRFQTEDYDTTMPLVIDPVLSYSTYLGGSGIDTGNAITVDSAGNAYVVGVTDSLNFPTHDARQPVSGGGKQDIFVAKLDPSGTQLVYSTYLGGNGQDNGNGLAVDSSGNCYLTGSTGSTNFPTANAMQPAKLGSVNAFVAKLDPTGSALIYSTYLGGSAGDYGSGIAVDSAGDTYVTGVSTSPDFPRVNPLQRGNGGDADVFIARLNAGGSALVYSTYLGGQGNDGGAGIAVDSAGNAYVTGLTSSTTFRTANAIQASNGGGLFDAFALKLSPDGEKLTYSTYIGHSGNDQGFHIAIDGSGNAYVTGRTDSPNFPAVNQMQSGFGGVTDAFVMKLNSTGVVVYSTFLGGAGSDFGTGIAVDSSGNAHVTGFTDSANFPTAEPLQAVNRGNGDAFVSELDASGSALLFSTYLGGSGWDAGFDIAVDSSGAAYVIGQTSSDNLPTARPLQPNNAGGALEIFVTKLGSGLSINSASISGKMLIVNGQGFNEGAKIILNDEVQKKTANDEQNPATTLIARKAGKLISGGQIVTLQVQNPDGSVSNKFLFTRQ